MGEETISQKITLKNIEKIKNYLDKEIHSNKFMTKRHKIILNTFFYYFLRLLDVFQFLLLLLYLILR